MFQRAVGGFMLFALILGVGVVGAVADGYGPATAVIVATSVVTLAFFLLLWIAVAMKLITDLPWPWE